jgi:hypothetical protein
MYHAIHVVIMNRLSGLQEREEFGYTSLVVIRSTVVGSCAPRVGAEGEQIGEGRIKKKTIARGMTEQHDKSRTPSNHRWIPPYCAAVSKRLQSLYYSQYYMISVATMHRLQWALRGWTLS